MSAGEKCSRCGRILEPGEVTYRRVVGWAKDRGATGGANGLRLRQFTGESACAPCIEVARNARATGQNSLL